MHKILFLNDLSDHAPAAYRYATALAGRFNAMLSQVCCNAQMELPLHRGPERQAHILSELEQFAHTHAEADDAALTIEHLPHWIEEADVAEELATEIRAGLIVIPESEPRTAALARQLARRSPLPLLLIPPKAQYRPFRKLVFATSFHFNDLIALNLLRRWRHAFDAQLDIIHVLESESERALAAEKMGAFAETFSDAPGLAFQLLSGDAPRLAILEYLKQQEADLLALTTHRRSAWEAFIESSTSGFMAKESPIPVLVVKDLDYVG